MPITTFINDSTSNNSLHYPNKSGVIALVDDLSTITPVEHYRGVSRASVSTPADGDYVVESGTVWYYSGGQWIKDNVPTSVNGNGTVLYFTSTTQGAAETLSATPDLSGLDEEQIVVTIANTPVALGHIYKSEATVGTSSTPAGQWGVTLFARSTDTSHNNKIRLEIGTSDGVLESWHFGIDVSVTTTTTTEHRAVVVVPSYPCAPTDKYVVKVSGISDTNNVTFTFCHSDAHAYSFVTTPPSATLHNKTPDINTGNYLHVTLAQLAKLNSLKDHYRGTNYLSVTSPLPGDYCTQTLTTMEGTVNVNVQYVPDGTGWAWKRTTPIYLGAGFDTDIISFASSIPFPTIGFCQGDMAQIQTDYAMAGGHIETYTYTGNSWANVSNSDYAMTLFSLQSAVTALETGASTIDNRVTALESMPVESHYKGHYPLDTNTLDIPAGVSGDYVVIENNTYGDTPYFWSVAYSDWLMFPNLYQTISIANNANTYRGNNHNTVTGAGAGDYTVESGGILWVYDTSWHQVSGGSGGLDHYKGHFLTEAAVDAVTGVAGDYATYSYLTEISGTAVDRLVYWDATYNGGVGGWMDVLNGIDASEKFNVRDKRSYVGTNHNSPSITPTAGAYTVETGGILWVYDGATWNQQGLRYWNESVTATTTKLVPKTGTKVDFGIGNSSLYGADYSVLTGQNNIAKGAFSLMLGKDGVGLNSGFEVVISETDGQINNALITSGNNQILSNQRCQIPLGAYSGKLSFISGKIIVKDDNNLFVQISEFNISYSGINNSIIHKSITVIHETYPSFVALDVVTNASYLYFQITNVTGVTRTFSASLNVNHLVNKV